MESKRNLGIIILSIGILTLVAAILFISIDRPDLYGSIDKYNIKDKGIMFAALLIMYISLILIFIFYKGPDIDYLSGLYLVVVIITLFIALSYDISYGLLLLLTITLGFTLLVITKVSKQYYLLIVVIVLAIALALQEGLYS